MQKLISAALLAAILAGSAPAFAQMSSAPGLQPLPGAPRGQIPGAIGTAAAAGNIGETITTQALCVTTTGLTSPAAGYAVMNVSLTAGTWLVSGVAAIDLGASAVLGTFDAVINTTSGGGSGLGIGSPGYVGIPYSGATGAQALGFNIPAQIIRLSTTTSAYLSYNYVTFSGGTAGPCGRIDAVRVQ